MEAVFLDEIVAGKRDHWRNYKHIQSLQTFANWFCEDGVSFAQEIMRLLGLISCQPTFNSMLADTLKELVVHLP